MDGGIGHSQKAVTVSPDEEPHRKHCRPVFFIFGGILNVADGFVDEWPPVKLAASIDEMNSGWGGKRLITILRIIAVRRKESGKHHQQVESHQKPDRQCSAFSFHNPGQTIWNSPQRTQCSETTTKPFFRRGRRGRR